MLGRRLTCTLPSRTWICSAVYATSAPKGWGLRLRTARGFWALLTGISALPAWRTCRDQLGRVSGHQFYRISSSKMASGGPLTGLILIWFPAQDGVLALALQKGVDTACRGHLVQAADGQAVGRVMQPLPPLFCLAHDARNRRCECVPRPLAFGLRGLRPERLRYDQRPVERWG